MCREANLTSSSSWIYIAYKVYWLIWFYPSLISLFLTKRGRKFFMWFDFTLNPLLMIDKKGEKYLWVICMFSLLKGEKYLSSLLIMHIFCILQLGAKDLICVMIASPTLHTCHVLLLPYLLFIWYAWVKGELLWSFTLIHAYITPWVLSSSKRGRLLAQRPFTLVLMMINSCSYSY